MITLVIMQRKPRASAYTAVPPGKTLALDLPGAGIAAHVTNTSDQQIYVKTKV